VAHINPDGVQQQALLIYRSEFKPSESLKEPYVIVLVLSVAADIHEKAKRFLIDDLVEIKRSYLKYFYNSIINL
jgi:hypothetical protein